MAEEQGGTLFVLEDDAVIRDRIVRLIDASRRYRISAVAASLGEAAAASSAAQASSILLVDLRLPDGVAIDFIREASNWQPRPRIAVFSVLGDELNVIGALQAGADGYLLKDLRDEELVPALDALRRGESPMSPAIARHLLRRFVRTQPAAEEGPGVKLTEREVEVLDLIAKGYVNQEIASSLEIAVSTVVTHVKHVYEKLNVHSRSAAVFEAAQLGLIRVGH